ncbi:TIGR04076 family protein [Synergistaceae bacterium OttesenSCG-928-D05]|nr:TIGR04076 family protein [Synergistaceae bacterium OttesenSCG-928-D05]
MQKKKIKLTVIDRKGPRGCSRGHKIGDTFDLDTEDRGRLCPRVTHVCYPYADTLRYGGEPPCKKENGEYIFCCPDVDTINVFRMDAEDA